MKRDIDVTALGEVLIDFTPGGVSQQGQPLFERNPGGAPANVLAALAKWGKRTAFIGKVGEDAFGRYLADVLAECGIDCRGLVRTSRANTTLAFVHLDESGDRSFSFYRNPGADMLLDISDVSADQLTRPRIFHFGSVSMSAEPAATATLQAAQRARIGGTIISFDPNLRPPLWSDLENAKRKIEAGMQLADFVKLSEEELHFLTGTNDLELGTNRIAERFRTPLMFVTLAERGCFFNMQGHTGLVPGFAVQTVDTTGAGDTFVAAMLYQLLETGWKPGEQVEDLAGLVAFANAAGALATRKKGAIPAIPAYDEIRKLATTHRP
ncbi:carbohydrate kinase [Xylanibacillus composti]|uniref:Fructokinase n=1 Tax=Xylanibacillus composti TaxID=1572762 RepID=A0A8J4H8L9_9BACL|nr:carbohydrate kinase [Xylanibacillus composti]MDT9724001.1 carbohydrate kinase [Xylanibacillus composti]GIQ71094.1 fructokinase [Xylanibacillus composti]